MKDASKQPVRTHQRQSRICREGYTPCPGCCSVPADVPASANMRRCDSYNLSQKMMCRTSLENSNKPSPLTCILLCPWLVQIDHETNGWVTQSRRKTGAQNDFEGWLVFHPTNNVTGSSTGGFAAFPCKATNCDDSFRPRTCNTSPRTQSAAFRTLATISSPTFSHATLGPLGSVVEGLPAPDRAKQSASTLSSRALVRATVQASFSP